MNEWKELGGEEKEGGGFAPPTTHGYLEWRKLRKRGEEERGRQEECGIICVREKVIIQLHFLL
jgi:hypothetical protein